MRKNQSLAKWRAGGQTIGGWLSLASTHVAELMAHAGFDWLCIDLQHGLLDYGDLRNMLPAISTTETTPIVRVAGNDAKDIMKVLDVGAMAVIVPMINSRADAVAAVAACRYPPQGERSFGPLRAALYGGPNYVRDANDEIACIAMIETREGLENLEEIVTTPGLGGVYIGPIDLAYALGLPPQGDTDDPLHMATVARILGVCQQHGVPVGIHTSSLDYTRKRLDAGFNFVALGHDAGFMMQAAAAQLAEARGSVNEESIRTGY